MATAAAAAPAFGAAAAPAAVCASCGNVFLEDSRYCRKCGKPRGTTIAGSSPKSGSSTSVMPGGKGIGGINPIGGSALVANGAAVTLQGTGLRALEGSTVGGIYAAQTPADITTSSAGGGLLGGSTASAWQVGQNASSVGPLGGSVRMAATGSSSSSYVAAPAPVIGANPGATTNPASASVPPGWWPPANPSSYVAPSSPCPVAAADASAHLRKAGRKPLAADRVQHGESQVTPSPVKAIPLEVARATMATNQPRQPLGGAEIVASARPISTGELSAGGFLVRNLGRQGEAMDPMAAIPEQPGAESAAAVAEQQRAALERQAAELAAAEQVAAVAAQRAAAERAAMELSVAAERAAAERAAAERALAEQTQRAAAERAAAERAAAERAAAERLVAEQAAAADRATAERMAAEQAAAQARAAEAERRMIAEREAAAAAAAIAEQQAAVERQAAAEKQAALVAAAAAAAAQATAERQAAADKERERVAAAAVPPPTTGEVGMNQAGPLRPAVGGAPLPSSDYIPMAEVVERRSRPAAGGAPLQTEEALPEIRPGGSRHPQHSEQQQKPVQIPDTSWELPVRTATVAAVSGGLPQQQPQQDSFQMASSAGAANPLPSALGSAAVLSQPGLGLGNEASGAGFEWEVPPPPPSAAAVLAGTLPPTAVTTGMEPPPPPSQQHGQGEHTNYITAYQLERMAADDRVPPPPLASADDERRFGTIMQPPSSLTLPVQSRSGAMPSPFFETSEPPPFFETSGAGPGTGINPFDGSSADAIGTNVVASAATAGNVGTMVVGVRYDDDGFPIED